jgi:imidazolonepropionase-like amidohydrolase
MPGPRIIIASGSFVYRSGTPSYLPKGLLPELISPEQATPVVEHVLDSGVEGIKIFSGSFQTPTHTVHLPPEIIRTVTSLAHERGAFVVSHPTDLTGFVNAVENGVDILAHTSPQAGKLPPELFESMLARKVALIPTLKLWRWELERHQVAKQVVDDYIRTAVEQLRDYHAMGGEVLFGTDAGYMKDYDTEEEFELMARAGLDYRAILSSLTVAPGRRFASSEAARSLAGVIEVGAHADLVILRDDPAADVQAFARPAATIRAGKLVFHH